MLSDNCPSFSLVIPAYNEERYLPGLLDSVAVARGRYPGAVEVIVADNLSTDRSADIARDRDCRVVHVGKRLIAAARNGGASAATGDILCFVDADSHVHPDVFQAIADVMTEKVVGGSTGVKMERMSLGIGITYALMVPWVWLTGMDTGLVFCRREDFERIGGYREDRLYSEDVHFMVALRKLGRSRRPKQRLVRVRNAKTITSTRKFDRYGDWHYFWVVFRGFFGMFRPTKRSDEFARKYWYDDPER